MQHPVFARFTPATAKWFTGAFKAPTAAQIGAWEAVAEEKNALVIAPTGSGKTLAAFLWALDSFLRNETKGTKVLYISPLKALGVDVERNLRAPLIGITQTTVGMGQEAPDIRVGIRTGDTPAAERRAQAKNPPEILITTPESLFLLLTSKARAILATVDTVIVDEVHALADSKRGAHLALSLERLDALLEKPAQRIGLSATVEPAEEVARFLGGSHPVDVVRPTSEKTWELNISVPVEDMTALPELDSDDPVAQSSLWPHIHRQLAELIQRYRSTIIFVNSRRTAERLTTALNDLIDPDNPFARAHHGSVSKEERAEIEDALKSGTLRCVVATSTLELGIDMGEVDAVIQVEAPPSVASSLQRVGRAGHQVGETSIGWFLPKHRADLVESAVIAERMRTGAIEPLSVPANPLDVLAQHVVSAAAMDEVDVEEFFETVRGSASFASLSYELYASVLDLLAGKYPSDEFSELRPRIIWDREAGTLTGRPGAQRLAVTSGGTIPDRGLFGVFLAGSEDSDARTGGRRVGELDEEMVYESRVGEIIILGTTSWQIQEITPDRVLVTPAFGQPGKLPFWRGDAEGRPIELGIALGQFRRDILATDSTQRLHDAGADENAAANIIGYLSEQREATGRIPTDKTLVIERFTDELGDWRLILHSPYGNSVHAPWALAIGARLKEQFGFDAQALAADDGIVLRIPATDANPPGAELFSFQVDELEDVVRREVSASALFAARFRENAARALLLPRRDPGKRTPLWQQRQRASQLLQVAAKYPQFPIILETVREVLQDVYNLPALRDLVSSLDSGTLNLVEVETRNGSPFAHHLLFGYTAQFLYEADAPLAERRAAALSLDSGLLAQILGQAELRELLDEEVIAAVEADAQRLSERTRARGKEGVADLLRVIGAMTSQELSRRVTEPAELPDYLEQLRAEKRIFIVNDTYAAVEDAARLRDGLGIPLPMGIPTTFLEPVADPLGDLIARYARTHGPFTAEEVAESLHLGVAVINQYLQRLVAENRIVAGAFRPRDTGVQEYCDVEILRKIRRRSLAALRADVEPVTADAFARFLVDRQGVGAGSSGVEAVADALDQLAGFSAPASAWESFILPARVKDYRPQLLDELLNTGEFFFTGVSAASEGWLSFHQSDTADLTVHKPAASLTYPETSDFSPVHFQILDALDNTGAWHFADLFQRVETTDANAVAEALWDLFWVGLVTNDSFAAVRASVSGAHKTKAAAPRARRARSSRSSRLSRLRRMQDITDPLENIALTPRNRARVTGRFSRVDAVNENPTLRTHAQAEYLLDRYGVITRGSVNAEDTPGGFGVFYRLLTTMEDAGQIRRGYFIEGLGAAQFATAETIDALRGFEDADAATVGLAATDPANPYGAALPWPEPPTEHRPGRKPGGIVVLCNGELAAYLEKGGKSLLLFAENVDDIASALVQVLRTARIDKLNLETCNGETILNTPIAAALLEAGFYSSPSGLRFRS